MQQHPQSQMEAGPHSVSMTLVFVFLIGGDAVKQVTDWLLDAMLYDNRNIII